MQKTKRGRSLIKIKTLPPSSPTRRIRSWNYLNEIFLYNSPVRSIRHFARVIKGGSLRLLLWSKYVIFSIYFCSISTCEHVQFYWLSTCRSCRIDIRRKHWDVFLYVWRPAVSHVSICRQGPAYVWNLVRDMEWFPTSKDSRRPDK